MEEVPAPLTSMPSMTIVATALGPVQMKKHGPARVVSSTATAAQQSRVAELEMIVTGNLAFSEEKQVGNILHISTAI